MSRLSGTMYQFTWDPASIASNSQATLNVSIPKARLGDFLLCSAETDLSHLMLYGHVEADGTGDLHLHNATGGPVNLGEMVINVKHVPKDVL